MKELREQIIDIILQVAMTHHDDISATDEMQAENSADQILALMPKPELASGEEIEELKPEEFCLTDTVDKAEKMVIIYKLNELIQTFNSRKG